LLIAWCIHGIPVRPLAERSVFGWRTLELAGHARGLHLLQYRLAVLEVFAYRKARKPLTPRHLYRVTLDEGDVTWLQPAHLPDDWMVYPHPASTQAIGDAWVDTGNTLALAVPSVLTPQEYNIVLNCGHPGFNRLQIAGPEEFPFNPRLTPDA
jgi:RES domain-containing protein